MTATQTEQYPEKKKIFVFLLAELFARQLRREGREMKGETCSGAGENERKKGSPGEQRHLKTPVMTCTASDGINGRH